MCVFNLYKCPCKSANGCWCSPLATAKTAPYTCQGCGALSTAGMPCRSDGDVNINIYLNFFCF